MKNKSLPCVWVPNSWWITLYICAPSDKSRLQKEMESLSVMLWYVVVIVNMVGPHNKTLKIRICLFQLSFTLQHFLTPIISFYVLFLHCDRVSFILLIHNCCLITLIVQHPIHSFISFIYAHSFLFVVFFIISIFFIHPFSHYASVNFCAVILFKLFSRSKQHDTKRQNQLFEKTHTEEHEFSRKLTLLPHGYRIQEQRKNIKIGSSTKGRTKERLGYF